MTDHDWTIVIGITCFAVLGAVGVGLVFLSWMLRRENEAFERRNKDLQ